MAKGVLLMLIADTVVENAKKSEILFEKKYMGLRNFSNFFLQRMR